MKLPDYAKASGLNDRRKHLETLLQQDDYDILLVEHKDGGSECN